MVSVDEPAPVVYLDYQLGYAATVGETKPQRRLPVPNIRQKNDQNVMFDTLSSYCYSQAKASVQLGKELADGWRVAISPKLGCVIHISELVRMRVDAQAPYWYNAKKASATDATAYYQRGFVPQITLSGQYDLSSEQALRLRAVYRQHRHGRKDQPDQKSDTRVSLSWLTHF